MKFYIGGRALSGRMIRFFVFVIHCMLNMFKKKLQKEDEKVVGLYITKQLKYVYF